MKSAPECIPCFFRQAVAMARSVGLDASRQFEAAGILAARMLPEFDPLRSPPEHSAGIQQLITEMSGVSDPFARAKRESNREALAAVPMLTELIDAGQDPLKEAAMLAIAGNIIDFGVMHSLDVPEEIRRILKRERRRAAEEEERGSELFDYLELRKALKQARTILYLGDNAGEIVFDRLFIERIRKEFPGIAVTFVVRDAPVLNDVTVKEAEEVGMSAAAEVMSSGCCLPGTLLRSASADFRTRFTEADIVISKGQGNYESLAGDAERDVFFLFMVKCSAVAAYVGAELFDIILTRKR